MDDRIFDSELKLMELIWEQEGTNVTAKELSRQAEESIGWNKNTTYTVIKKCVEKGFVSRNEPGFLCHALITLDEVRQEETRSLADRLFDGAADKLFAALVTGRKLTSNEMDNIQRIIREMR